MIQDISHWLILIHKGYDNKLVSYSDKFLHTIDDLVKQIAMY